MVSDPTEALDRIQRQLPDLKEGSVTVRQLRLLADDTEYLLNKVKSTPISDENIIEVYLDLLLAIEDWKPTNADTHANKEAIAQTVQVNASKCVGIIMDVESTPPAIKKRFPMLLSLAIDSKNEDTRMHLRWGIGEMATIEPKLVSENYLRLFDTAGRFHVNKQIHLAELTRAIAESGNKLDKDTSQSLYTAKVLKTLLSFTESPNSELQEASLDAIRAIAQVDDFNPLEFSIQLQPLFDVLRDAQDTATDDVIAVFSAFADEDPTFIGAYHETVRELLLDEQRNHSRTALDLIVELTNGRRRHRETSDEIAGLAPDVAEFLTAPDSGIREKAAKALASIAAEHPKHVAPIKDEVTVELESSNAAVRKSIVATVGHLLYESCIEEAEASILASAARDESDAVRRQAIKSITKLARDGDTKLSVCLSPLSDAVQDDNKDLAASATEALAKIASNNPAEAADFSSSLRVALTSSDWAERNNAAQAYDSISDETPNVVVNALDELMEIIIEADSSNLDEKRAARYAVKALQPVGRREPEYLLPEISTLVSQVLEVERYRSDRFGWVPSWVRNVGKLLGYIAYTQPDSVDSEIQRLVTAAISDSELQQRLGMRCLRGVAINAPETAAMAINEIVPNICFETDTSRVHRDFISTVHHISVGYPFALSIIEICPILVKYVRRGKIPNSDDDERIEFQFFETISDIFCEIAARNIEDVTNLIPELIAIAKKSTEQDVKHVLDVLGSIVLGLVRERYLISGNYRIQNIFPQLAFQIGVVAEQSWPDRTDYFDQIHEELPDELLTAAKFSLKNVNTPPSDILTGVVREISDQSERDNRVAASLLTLLSQWVEELDSCNAERRLGIVWTLTVIADEHPTMLDEFEEDLTRIARTEPQIRPEMNMILEKLGLSPVEDEIKSGSIVEFIWQSGSEDREWPAERLESLAVASPDLFERESEKIKALLQDGSPTIRQKLISAISELPSESIYTFVPSIAEALTYPETKTQLEAASALADLGYSHTSKLVEVAPQLVKALDPSEDGWDVGNEAQQTREIIGRRLRSISIEDPSIFEDCVPALIRSITTVPEAGNIPWSDNIIDVIDNVARESKTPVVEVVPDLVDSLTANEPAIQIAAADTLEEILSTLRYIPSQESLVSHVQDLLKSEEDSVRRSAAHLATSLSILGWSGPANSNIDADIVAQLVPQLELVVRRDRSTAQQHAMKALRDLAREDPNHVRGVLPTIIDTLSIGDDTTNEIALETLNPIASEYPEEMSHAIPETRTILHSSDSIDVDVRDSAAELLAELLTSVTGSLDEDIDAVETILTESDMPYGAISLAISLANTAPESARRLLPKMSNALVDRETSTTSISEFFVTLAENEPEPVKQELETLVSIFKDEMKGKAWYVAVFFKEISNKRPDIVVPCTNKLLIQISEKGLKRDSYLAEAVKRATVEQPESLSTAAGTLIDHLDHPDLEVQAHCLIALSYIGSDLSDKEEEIETILSNLNSNSLPQETSQECSVACVDILHRIPQTSTALKTISKGK